MWDIRLINTWAQSNGLSLNELRCVATWGTLASILSCLYSYYVKTLLSEATFKAFVHTLKRKMTKFNWDKFMSFQLEDVSVPSVLRWFEEGTLVSWLVVELLFQMWNTLKPSSPLEVIWTKTAEIAFSSKKNLQPTNTNIFAFHDRNGSLIALTHEGAAYLYHIDLQIRPSVEKWLDRWFSWQDDRDILLTNRCHYIGVWLKWQTRAFVTNLWATRISFT